MCYNRCLSSLFLWGLLTLTAMGLVGGCSPARYKDEADKQVYNIINSKWKAAFGEKTNYIITDSNIPHSPNDILIEDPESISGVLSLVRAVSVATGSNRNYQTQKEELYLEALDLTLDRHDFAKQWFGTIDSAYANDGTDEALGSGTGFGFSQLLADGTAVSASIAIDWARFLTGDPRTSLASVLSTTITKPLLRGAGREVAQENLKQSERDVLYQIRSFNRYRKTFVVSVVSEYYRTLQLRDSVENARSNYERVAQSRDRLQVQVEIGLSPPFEVDQAEQNVLTARDSFVQTTRSYEQQLDGFKLLLGLPTDANITLDQSELMALQEIGISQPDYELETAVETALNQRLDLANSRDYVDDTFRKIKVAANNLGADLNLIFESSVPSTPDKDYKRLRFHEGAYGLALEADFPFDRKAERNDYRRALITLQQQQRQYGNAIDEVKFQVREAYRLLQESAQRYEIQRSSLKLAEKRVESTQLFLELGKASARDLLESQAALVLAQNNLTSALVGHAIAKLRFFRDIGVLQVKPDGMWAQSEQEKRTSPG